ncbi:SpoIID/LytB domain-containing protein [Gelria sp. Kuro-4]|uniref:SpoIID/LytB domain-containing protein n=1 Tax=Gelria sp. Kuro-4 TaxID=2796927 RepID=UPI001BF0B779|nr:SpoIID/LytB domain-containing protein [Gelria sp. Kuro-4]BCV25222.1 hypothetical protein kuro4_19950 [Gelria sp. Kuro-4]
MVGKRYYGAVGLGLFLAFFLVAAPAQAAPVQLRVRLLTAPVSVVIGAARGFVLTDAAGRPLGAPAGAAPVTLTVDGQKVVLPDGRRAEQVHIVAAPLAADNLLRVDGRPYRGSLEVRATGAGLVVINVVTVEDYLRGTVPLEMPPTWPEEALKAQAVAARTFAYRNQGRHAGEGFDLCAGTHCQAYGGAGVETAATDRAVKETADLVLRYNGELIDAYYHASSGGHTEAAGAVWGTDRPYLKGVEDGWDQSPYAQWEASFSPEEVSALLAQAGFALGDVETIEPSAYTPSGRVASFSVQGSSGREVIPAEKLRQALGPTVLKSTWLTVVSSPPVPQGRALVTVQGAEGTGRAAARPGTWAVTASGVKMIPTQTVTRVGGRGAGAGRIVFRGRGYGHGVGMSQWGAKGMAEHQGTSVPDFYRAILTHYYQGVTIEPY